MAALTSCYLLLFSVEEYFLFSVTLLQLLNYRKLSSTITLCHFIYQNNFDYPNTWAISYDQRGSDNWGSTVLWFSYNLPIDVRGHGKGMEKQSMSDQKRVYVSLLLGFKNCRKDIEEEHFSF